MTIAQVHPAPRQPNHIINFATGADVARLPTPRQTPVQKLCATFEQAMDAFLMTHTLFAKAETAAMKARPKADARIRPTKRNVRDLVWSTPGKRVPLTAAEIETAIKSLRCNNTTVKKTEGGTSWTVHADVQPLTHRQKLRLARLEARLPIAIAYEAKIAAIEKRIGLDRLEAAIGAPADKLEPLAARIAKLKSRNRDDLLAKARICEADPDMGSTEEVAKSIVFDIARLAASGAI